MALADCKSCPLFLWPLNTRVSPFGSSACLLSAPWCLIVSPFPTLHSQEGPAQEDLRTAHASSKELRRKEEGRRE